MIISASRRTDVPAFYAEWFVRRVEEGRLAVRNPMNPHMISEWSFSPETIDCIVFWTKNPSPIIPLLPRLNPYKFYFQFTLNPYGLEIEPMVPKKNLVIDRFAELSDSIGKEKVVWRYDPILFSPTIDLDYHKKYFEVLTKRLEGKTEHCVISFLDVYKKIDKRLKEHHIAAPGIGEIAELAKHIADVAQGCGMTVGSCSEIYNLEEYGIKHNSCIDKELIERIAGYRITAGKDPGQRKECGCVKSVDIGEYNSCPHGCAYCYASFSALQMEKKRGLTRMDSPLMVGEIEEGDKIAKHIAKSLRDERLF